MHVAMIHGVTMYTHNHWLASMGGLQFENVVIVCVILDRCSGGICAVFVANSSQCIVDLKFNSGTCYDDDEIIADAQ